MSALVAGEVAVYRVAEYPTFGSLGERFCRSPDEQRFTGADA